MDSAITSAKNNTRIASLLGTWTGTTHLKTDIGSYELMAYFVIHLMPDPMRGYTCSLDDCKEVENKACVLNAHGDGECKDIADTLLDWSDVSAFLYFGAKIDVGFPFNKHRAEDTGGWVGPMNIVMAQDNSFMLDASGTGTDIADSQAVVDRYISRYVQTPSTEFIQMPKNCTLLREEDFRKIAGDEAVKQTAEAQYDPNSNNDPDEDPYEQYLNTCENGDVKPLLPLFQFDFIKADEESDEEAIEVKLNYKLMTMPRKKDYMYDIYPKIMNRVNKANLGFHISGPYCYGDDPKRGYSFDMNFDSRSPKQMMKLEHACVEGLPCAPPAAELYVLSGGSSIDVKPIPDDATTVDVAPSIFFAIVVTMLSSVIFYLYRSNQKLRTRLEGDAVIGQPYLDASLEDNGSTVESEAVATRYQTMNEEEVSAEIDEIVASEADANSQEDEETQNLLPE